ncbi:MAG: proline dehydrogenase family protein [Bacteroidota bacterium]
MKTSISFDDTAIAFAHKSNSELKKAHWLFAIMAKSWLVKLGSKITPWAIKIGLPIKGLLRQTIFKQFVGGETLEASIVEIKKLEERSVQAIMDYGVEGMEGEKSYDSARDEFIRVIEFAASQKNVPFMSVKITGMGRFSLLEKLDALMHASANNTLIKKYNDALQQLDESELAEWQNVVSRFQQVCDAAHNNNVGFLVDAEESWIQDPVDAVTMLMMDAYNRNTTVIYNTIQLYRHDRLAFLHQSFEAAVERNFLLGVKLVRGAYMEKERKRAAEKKYASPIQPSKKATDNDYNDALCFCLEHLDRVGLIVATHNEESNLLAANLIEEKNLTRNHAHVHFSQLLGMSDNITYNLAAAGYSVSKYLPFGPIKDVVPYLMRRAQENTSVSGQTTRELELIKKERTRRKK